MSQNVNHAILDRILGKDGRCPIAEPWTGDEQDGADFIRYCETGKGEFEQRFSKFLPKERCTR